ncbi:MAG: DegT/DnrJ/EryC1/StrS family aminotransferase [Candidatus Latescibacterota bacterium]|nr:DegT/DnrJ/EryC1/StrS family aminotransferase [Candidatus Latescibacterota bacterium]
MRTRDITVDIPYVDIVGQHAAIKDELLAAVAGVIDRGQFVLGEEVGEFERRFAELCGVDYAVGVNSGTDALILALQVLGIGPGDEVITAPNSFVATVSAVRLVGATPVFADVGDDYNIDPGRVAGAISGRTRAILPVHLTGRACAMDPLREIATAHGLPLIEDCAQAVLASYRGQGVGSFGAMGCFSLHPLKTLNACGDGGVLTTDDAELYEKLLYLRNLGLKTREDCIAWGHNSRLDTVQAAMVLVKLRYLEEWTAQRRANAAAYQAALADVAEVSYPLDDSVRESAYHTFVVEVEDRDGLKVYLQDCGIGTAIHYPTPIHLTTAGNELGYGSGAFPVAERQAKRILSLPVFAGLVPEQLERVCRSIRSYYH